MNNFSSLSSSESSFMNGSFSSLTESLSSSNIILPIREDSLTSRNSTQPETFPPISVNEINIDNLSQRICNPEPLQNFHINLNDKSIPRRLLDATRAIFGNNRSSTCTSISDFQSSSYTSIKTVSDSESISSFSHLITSNRPVGNPSRYRFIANLLRRIRTKTKWMVVSLLSLIILAAAIWMIIQGNERASENATVPTPSSANSTTTIITSTATTLRTTAMAPLTPTLVTTPLPSSTTDSPITASSRTTLILSTTASSTIPSPSQNLNSSTTTRAAQQPIQQHPNVARVHVQICTPDKHIAYNSNPSPNWNSAERYCENNYSYNGMLAAINCPFEQQIFNAPLEHINYDPYIGGFKIGRKFQWVDGSPFDYTNWCPGQPSEKGNCIQIYHADEGACTAGQWKAVSCSLNTTFFCEYGNFTIESTTTDITTTTVPTTTTTRPPSTFCFHDSNPVECFAMVGIATPWSTGYCQAKFPNANLASLHNAVHHSVACSLMHNQNLLGNGNGWTGGRVFKGKFQWSDGTSLDTYGEHQFCPGEWPASSNVSGCVEILKYSAGSCPAGKWKIVPCTTKNAIVCKYSPPATAPPPPNCSEKTDCYDLYHCHGVNTSGIQTLYIPGVAPFQVYCDMETDGGGWTVFQRRIDNSLSFDSRCWSEYQLGFNNGLDKNFWLGLDRIHLLTVKDQPQTKTTLRIDLIGDRQPSNCPGTHLFQCLPNDRWFGTWQGFAVDAVENKYTFTIGSQIQGNVSLKESLTLKNGMKFTTYNQDNDNYYGSCGGGNCARCECGGGWWYFSGPNYCEYSQKFNGNYDSGCFAWYQVSTAQDGTFEWWRWPKISELKLRKAV